jgi:hypothetical protein
MIIIIKDSFIALILKISFSLKSANLKNEIQSKINPISNNNFLIYQIIIGSMPKILGKVNERRG